MIERLGHRFDERSDQRAQLAVRCGRCSMSFQDFSDMEDTLLHHPDKPEIAEWITCGTGILTRRH